MVAESDPLAPAATYRWRPVDDSAGLYHEVIFLRKKEVLLYVQALNQLYLQYQGVEGSNGISYGRESLG